jgi:hypothetical protein
MKKRRRRVNNYNVVAVVCKFFSITEKLFFSNCRKRTLVLARQISMYIMRHHGNVCTYQGIRDFFKFRNSVSNHATVMHAVKAIDMEMEYNTDLKEQVEAICEELSIHNRHYIDIYWFMKVEKGNKIHLKYGLEKEKDILWEHHSIERRSGRMYIKGKYFSRNKEWIERDDMMYEEDGFICAGDGYKVFATGNKVLI